MKEQWIALLFSYGMAAGAFLCAVLLNVLLRHSIFPLCMRFAEKSNRPYAAVILQAFLKPASYMILLLGQALCISLLPFAWRLHPVYRTVQAHILNLGFILLFAWGFWGVNALVPRVVQSLRGRLDLDTGKALSHFIMRICQALILSFTGVMVISELGYDVNGLVAGLGLGGLTVALAAKDAASNFLGGFTIITERPFEIGDWINASGMEGTVEDITLRSTKIRTLNNALTIVPNSQLCTAPITNWTRMNMRLAQFTLGVPYSTSRKKVQAVTQGVRILLETHADVRSETVQVRLSQFGASSLDIMVQFYTFTTDIVQFRIVREDIHFQIMDLMQTLGVSFAFPSQSLYMESPMIVNNPKEGPKK